MSQALSRMIALLLLLGLATLGASADPPMPQLASPPGPSPLGVAPNPSPPIGSPLVPPALTAPIDPGPNGPTVVDSWIVDAHPPTIGKGNAGSLAEQFPFNAGEMTFQFLSGYYNRTSWGPSGPGFSYAPQVARIGYMLTSPTEEHWLCRGSLEMLLELNYSPVLEEFGTYMTGPNLLLRYNFVQPECLLVPYIQGGGGFVLTDAWKAKHQDLIGQEFEFLLRGDIGARLMLLDCLSLDAEVGYQHLNNASLASRNGGVNAVGFSLGMTYFFGK